MSCLASDSFPLCAEPAVTWLPVQFESRAEGTLQTLPGRDRPEQVWKERERDLDPEVSFTPWFMISCYILFSCEHAWAPSRARQARTNESTRASCAMMFCLASTLTGLQRPSSAEASLQGLKQFPPVWASVSWSVKWEAWMAASVSTAPHSCRKQAFPFRLHTHSGRFYNGLCPSCGVSSKVQISLFVAFFCSAKISEHQLCVQLCRDTKDVKVTVELLICFRIQDEKLQDNPSKSRLHGQCWVPVVHLACSMCIHGHAFIRPIYKWGNRLRCCLRSKRC